MFWELLLSSLTPSFQGFHDGRYQTEKESIYLETVDITLEFGKYDLIQRESGKSSGEFWILQSNIWSILEPFPICSALVEGMHMHQCLWLQVMTNDILR